MLAALGVGEVGAIILVDGEAEPALEGADMVLEEVRVFVEVDGFEGELAETFAPVGVGGAGRRDPAAAEFGSGPILWVLDASEKVMMQWIVETYLIIHTYSVEDCNDFVGWTSNRTKGRSVWLFGAGTSGS